MNFSEIRTRKKEIEFIAAQYGVKNIRIFGSVARGEADDQSDVDFIVEMDKGRTRLDRIGFMQDVEAILKIKIDVIFGKKHQKLDNR